MNNTNPFKTRGCSVLEEFTDLPRAVWQVKVVKNLHHYLDPALHAAHKIGRYCTYDERKRRGNLYARFFHRGCEREFSTCHFVTSDDDSTRFLVDIIK